MKKMVIIQKLVNMMLTNKSENLNIFVSDEIAEMYHDNIDDIKILGDESNRVKPDEIKNEKLGEK